jgi:hypothetical protein
MARGTKGAHNKEERKKTHNPTNFERFLARCITLLREGNTCYKVKTYINVVSDGYKCSTVFVFSKEEGDKGPSATLFPSNIIKPKDVGAVRRYNNQIKFSAELLDMYCARLYVGFCKNCGKLVFSDIPHQNPGFCSFCIYQKLEKCDNIVYLIRSPRTKLVKIGTTTNINQRINDLSNMHGDDLELVAAIPGSYELETSLHKMFDAYRVRGEWFLPSHKIITAFRELVKKAESGYVEESQGKEVEKDEKDTSAILIKKSMPVMYQIEELDELGIRRKK